MTLPYFQQAVRTLETQPSFAAVLLELSLRVRQPPPSAGQASAGAPGNQVTLAGLTDTAKALVAALLGRQLKRPVVLVTATNKRAEELAEPLRFFHGLLTGRGAEAVALLPARDVSPYRGLSCHPDIAEERAIALWRLATHQTDIVVAPVASALERLASVESYAGLARTIHKGDEFGMEELVTFLEGAGYQRHEPAEQPGQYSVRGGILDIYPPDGAGELRAGEALRLEFFGDELEELRRFDPATQGSSGSLTEATVLPLVEARRTPELLARLWELGGEAELDETVRGVSGWQFPGWEFLLPLVESRGGTLPSLLPGALVLLDEPEPLRQEAAQFWAKLEADHADHETSRAEHSQSVSPGELFLRWDAFVAATSEMPQLHLEHLPMEIADADHHILLTQPTRKFRGEVRAFMREVRERLGQGMKVLVAAANAGELDRWGELFAEFEVPFRLGMKEEGRSDSVSREGPTAVLLRGHVREGVVFPEAGLVLYGNHDLFDTAPAPARSVARPKSRAAAFTADIGDLEVGDYVVHVDHGIGLFNGIRKIQQDGVSGEFFDLEYLEGDRLYVPVVRADLVQRYRRVGEARPKLDKLGGITWQKTRRKTAKAIEEMAGELVQLYAKRRTVPGHAFAADTAWQGEFEGGFEWDETPDQTTAIAEVKQDMEGAQPMDRLLVGDVGFGKTEVAFRAAFKAVCDNKQVAVLAPTTVLAFQHYRNLKQRLAAFPLKAGMLSRLRSRAEQKQTLLDLETGALDIVIGTHRLLSKDVRFHDLGLLIVDEEQRFGVRAKERLKQLKASVDALTLTATPIPRTLHMAVAGLRDLSLMQTAPGDRLAIQTVVATDSDELVRSALEQELGREGQVYFVHDRIDDIFEAASRVKRLAPAARVGVAHGRLKVAELERVMLGFIRREFDVLVTTKIIENGLDIPLANTLIVDRADRFGLAELYQLRGRVGRSARRAYAYLLVRDGTTLSETARKRLAALKDFSELGAGFRLAALDLELRGAGNLLGSQQSGHINAVGFDLYTQMLERAVSQLKDGEAVPEAHTTLNLGVDLRIPEGYIAEERDRLRVYKKIAVAGGADETERLRQDLEDRYGALPRAVEKLFAYAAVKGVAERLLIESVEARNGVVRVRFHPKTRVQPGRLVEFVRWLPGSKLDPDGGLRFPLEHDPEGNWLGALERRLLALAG